MFIKNYTGLFIIIKCLKDLINVKKQSFCFSWAEEEKQIKIVVKSWAWSCHDGTKIRTSS